MESLEIVAMGKRGDRGGQHRRGLVGVMDSHPTRVATQTRNIEVGGRAPKRNVQREPTENGRRAAPFG